MTVKKVKTNLHALIDNIQNIKLLEHLYEVLLNYNEKGTEKDFWNLFSEDQKHELDEAFKEIENEENLISNEVVMDKAKKWVIK